MVEEGDDAVLTDDDLVLPRLEVRVPPDWQSKLPVKLLTAAGPMPQAALLAICASALQRKVKQVITRDSDGTRTLPLIVWEDLLSSNGSHKAAEKVLASFISGVEAHWTSHATIEAFGELCGMLKADYSESLVRRVLSLFKPGDDTEKQLVNVDELGDALKSEWGSAVDVDVAKAALSQLRLSELTLSSLCDSIDKLADVTSGQEMKRVRIDQLLLAIVGAIRSTLGEEEQATDVEPEMAQKHARSKHPQKEETGPCGRSEAGDRLAMGGLTVHVERDEGSFGETAKGRLAEAPSVCATVMADSCG